MHFAGQPCEMDEIHRIAEKYKLPAIEDACHALGAKYKSKKIGGLSAMSVFSFHPVKSITTGEGGAILTDNKKYYDKLLLLRSHGMYKDRQGKNIMIDLGFNYRLTDIQAAMGSSQLKKLDKFIKQRRKIVAWYKEELKNVRQIILPRELKGNYSSWHIYVIRTVKGVDRDKLAEFLKEKGVGVNFHYPAVYAHPYYRKSGCGNIKLPNEEIFYNSCLTIPCYVGLSRGQVKIISNLIKSFYGVS